MRRVLGILSGILLLHVSLTAGDFACASHAQQMVHGDHGSMDAGMRMGDDAGMSDVSAARNAPDEHCATPVTTECCTAMASCGVTLFADARAAGSVSMRAGSGPLSALLVATAGVAGPETPPPRA